MFPYEWVDVFMGKRTRDVSRGYLSTVVTLSDFAMTFYVYTRQKDDYQFRDITYTSYVINITELKIIYKINNFSDTGSTQIAVKTLRRTY